jgi:uncharacterized protein (TIGR02118 family)
MYTVIYALYRRTAMSQAAFVEYWLNKHRPLAMQLPRLQGYEIWTVTDSDGAVGEGMDGLAVLRFDSREDFKRAHGSPEFAAAGEDTRNFVRHYTEYVVDVHSVM